MLGCIWALEWLATPSVVSLEFCHPVSTLEITNTSCVLSFSFSRLPVYKTYLFRSAWQAFFLFYTHGMLPTLKLEIKTIKVFRPCCKFVYQSWYMYHIDWCSHTCIRYDTHQTVWKQTKKWLRMCTLSHPLRKVYTRHIFHPTWTDSAL